ncbi:MAG TPA: CorA family divalent cation transporter [Sphingobacteriaceae bacterium]
MLQHLVRKEEYGFDWIDLTDPSREELQQVASQYDLHSAQLQDSLQPDHLPKYESTEAYTFIIFRIYTQGDTLEADTVQELTDKVAVFFSKQFVITIHRKKQDFLYDLIEIAHTDRNKKTMRLLNALCRGCMLTFEKASQTLSKESDYYEENVFLRHRKVSLLKGLYFLKRKIDLIRRVLILSYDIIDNIDAAEGDVDTRDTRDLYIKLQTIFDTLSDNVNQLINLYFSASAQKTNEIMRVLTVFSVFFLPLTFIVGIYGMNFEFMPELHMQYGYPAVVGLMIVVTIGIYIWFKRKGWL